MEVLQQDLLKIVEQASTLAERLGNCFVLDEAGDNDKLIMSRLKAWCQVVAQGNPEKLAKRLVWDGLDSGTIVRVLGAVRLANGQQPPVWAETLREVLQADLEMGDARGYRCLNPKEPIPFEEVYLPFIQVARQKLIAKVSDSWQLLSEAVHISLERQLLLKLASLCARSLELEFSRFKTVKQSASISLPEQQGRYYNVQYQTFVKDLKTKGLLYFFQKYSVLARLVATAMDFWVEEKAEFLQRLALDLPTIQQSFQEETGQVVEIQGNFSDSHNRGRSVMALTFASGLKLVYKPRGLALEAAYFQLLAWCNQHFVETLYPTSLHPFKLVKVIDYTTHGWMEYVEHLPCEDEAAAQRYYQRAGMLLCLLYVLQGNDCHDENLIACGEHPVLVDLETLVHPCAREVNPIEEVGAQSLASQQFFQNSVLRTGLLPRWEFGADGGTAHDISALGGFGEQETPFHIPKWQNINTDNMTLGYEPGIMPSQANTPFLNGITLLPNNYVNEIIDGFRQMYQFLAQRREALLATGSPLAVLAHQRVRFLFRNTQVYSHVLGKTLDPKFLQHGIDRSIELDVLSRAFLVADEKPSIWSILGVELQAMEQMDIPYFIADSSSDALTLNSDLIVKGYFRKPSYNRMISCLQQLNDTDLAQQIAIIRGSFYSRVARGMTSSLPTERVSASLNLDVIAPLTPAQLVQEVVEIAQELQQRAIYAADGSVTWIGMGYLPKAERIQLQPLSDGLYDGVCGVALFLAALAKVTGDAGFRDLALSALHDLKKVLQDKDPNSQLRIIKRMGIGGGTGLGSIVYTLVRVSQFLNEPELLDTASLAASFITQESIANDRSFDTIAGAAGTILGLLPLYQAKPNPAILDQAQALGYHLLNNRTKSETGFRAWATLEGKLATGISHGAAGIAYALLRLYKTTQDPVFLEAAEEAIAYERSVFSPTDGNWPDVRNFSLNKSKLSFMTSWCHGAPGIGLARLGSLPILDTAEIRQEIAVAINTTQQFGLHNIDHLCCGNFGRMEVLLVGASKLSRPDLWNTVQKQAARVVARAKQVGSFSLFSELSGDIYNPGLFQGTSGIGYELLRLAYPESLPSVLLWE
ncbi:MAG: type 2 lantipeptide synthetase LanM family protein [Scytonema hyalinum WJT4-NPBG1]|jgi:type 2 lantibiotic biosynthesis protein LanM|nr:type 2 lantipeptide synthetase LanM family protein [Scytonema hyalinum WJT4-NPBG1]